MLPRNAALCPVSLQSVDQPVTLSPARIGTRSHQQNCLTVFCKRLLAKWSRRIAPQILLPLSGRYFVSLAICAADVWIAPTLHRVDPFMNNLM